MREKQNFLRLLQILFVLILILLSSSYSHIFAVEKDEETKSESKSVFGTFPLIGYTPETKLFGGVAGIYTFHTTKDVESRPSSIPLAAMYTQNRQYSIGLSPEIYIKREEYRLTIELSLAKFPDRFYGIGNNTSDNMEEDYTPRTILLRTNFQKKIFAALNVGVQYQFNKSDVIEVEENGLLAKNQILGSEGGTSSGIGVLINWDNRNNVFYATKGGFYQMSSIIYTNALKSDYKFTQYNFDLRHYLPILSSHTLAFQGILNFMTGDVPFQNLSLLGGQNMMRGYYQGRYRDKNMIALQMEYRITPVWWRIGLVGFYGFGDVADKISNFEIKNFKHSVGLGLRLQLNPEEGLNLRIDLGYGEGSFEPYISVLETF